MLKILILFFALAIAVNNSYSQTDAAYTYRGSTLGSTTFNEQLKTLSDSDLRSWQMGFECFTPKDGTRFCPSYDKLNEYYTFVDDKLASLSFEFNSAKDLEGYVKGLSEKFGEPVVTTESYQNRMGASFTGRIWTWHNSLSGIVLEERGSNVYVSKLLYYDTKLKDEFEKRRVSKPDL